MLLWQPRYADLYRFMKSVNLQKKKDGEISRVYLRPFSNHSSLILPYVAKFIDESNADSVVIEMASLMEFVFQSQLCMAEDRKGEASHCLPSKLVPLLVKNNQRI